MVFFFFKQKTAYEMRISDWSSDVCSSDPDRACSRLRLMRSTECRGDESCVLLMVRFYLRPAWPNGCLTWVAEPSLTVQISLDSWREPTVSSRRSNALRLERTHHE